MILSQPGTPKPTLASMAADAAYRAVVKASAFDANLHPAAGGSLPNNYVTPAAFYGPNQFVHDTAYWMVMAPTFGKVAEAKAAFLNFGTAQQSNGMVPIYTGPGGAGLTNCSNPPILARAAWSLFVASGSTDTAWLTQAYAILKAWSSWWIGSRFDFGMGVFGWGDSNPNDAAGWADTPSSYTRISSVESGQDDVGWAYTDDEYTRKVAGQTYLSHMAPDLTAMWIMDVQYLAKIATALGKTSEAAGFTGQAADVTASFQRFMWDEIAGCPAMIQSTAVARTVGTCTAASGASSVQIAMAGAKTSGAADSFGYRFVRGALLDLGGGVTAQVAATVQADAGSTATVQIVKPLSAAVSGVTVKVRRFSQVRTLGFLAFPLSAGVLTAAQAQRVRDEHLFKTYDGTEDHKATFEFGASLATGYVSGSKYQTPVVDACDSRTKHVGWTPHFDAVAIGANADSFLGFPYPDSYGEIDGGRTITFERRWAERSGVDPTLQYAVPAWEAYDADHPLVVTVRGIATGPGGTCFPCLTIRGFGGAELLPKTQLWSHADNQPHTATYVFAPSTPTHVAAVIVGRTEDAGNTMALTGVDITDKPKGYVYMTPYGPLAQPRLARYSYAQTTYVSRFYSGSDGNHRDTPDSLDYWKGDIWSYLTWELWRGLRRYSMGTDADAVALAFVGAHYADYRRALAAGDTPLALERMGLKGTPKGAPGYGWACLGHAMLDGTDLI